MSASMEVPNKIWEEIKNMNIDLFGLPSQKVSNHVVKLDVPGDSLYVTISASAVLPALEEVLKDKFVVERNSSFVTIKRIDSSMSSEDEALRKAREAAERQIKASRDRQVKKYKDNS